MPNSATQIGFVPVTAEHFLLIRRWLEEPHVREWWGEPDDELGKIRDKVEGRDTTRPFIITADGEPVGYIQYWFVGQQQKAESIAEYPWLTELPADAVGVDLTIGEPTKLSQGIGSAALEEFVKKLLGEGFSNIVIDPDSDNARAIRAYEKVGFRPIPHLLGRTGDALIMQYVNANEIVT
jgi:RimJ/RimL family protein N-acetyltransferase